MIPILRTYRTMPNIINDVLNLDYVGGRTENYQGACKPAVNVIEDENAFQIEVAAPGFERSELKVTIDENLLTIASEPKEKKANNQKYLKKEYSPSAFNRSFELPSNVEAEKIEASHNNGVLTISIPKKAKVEIPVQEIVVN